MSIPSWAVRGAKVVRFIGHFGDGYEPGTEGVPEPKIGEVVTIAEVEPYGGRLVVAYVVIAEYPACEFALNIFRPVIEPKSEAEDVAMFHDLIRQPEHA